MKSIYKNGLFVALLIFIPMSVGHALVTNISAWAKVFDINGRAVGSAQGRPLREQWQEAGLHHVTFDGSGLPSGVYVSHLQAGENVASGKMVLLK
jgi:hypothetical protein